MKSSNKIMEKWVLIQSSSSVNILKVTKELKSWSHHILMRVKPLKRLKFCKSLIKILKMKEFSFKKKCHHGMKGVQSNTSTIKLFWKKQMVLNVLDIFQFNLILLRREFKWYFTIVMMAKLDSIIQMMWWNFKACLIK